VLVDKWPFGEIEAGHVREKKVLGREEESMQRVMGSSATAYTSLYVP
jgi:hypothetical protein